MIRRLEDVRREKQARQAKQDLPFVPLKAEKIHENTTLTQDRLRMELWRNRESAPLYYTFKQSCHEKGTTMGKVLYAMVIDYMRGLYKVP